MSIASRWFSVAVVAIGLASLNYMSFTSRLPGSQIPVQLLDQVVGRDCGQFTSTTGNSPCSSRLDCPTKGVNLPAFGTACSANGPDTSCGSCSGGTPITCQGTIFYNGQLCYTPSQPPCCSINNSCSTSITVNYGIAWYTCDCSGGNGNVAVLGTRPIATISYTSGLCSGG